MGGGRGLSRRGGAFPGGARRGRRRTPMRGVPVPPHPHPQPCKGGTGARRGGLWGPRCPRVAVPVGIPAGHRRAVSFCRCRRLCSPASAGGAFPWGGWEGGGGGRSCRAGGAGRGGGGSTSRVSSRLAPGCGWGPFGVTQTWGFAGGGAALLPFHLRAPEDSVWGTTMSPGLRDPSAPRGGS